MPKFRICFQSAGHVHNLLGVNKYEWYLDIIHSLQFFQIQFRNWTFPSGVKWTRVPALLGLLGAKTSSI
jgi:hypothetical protein